MVYISQTKHLERKFKDAYTYPNAYTYPHLPYLYIHFNIV